MYASPTSHFYWLDVLLAIWANVTVLNIQDEVYLNILGVVKEDGKNKIEELHLENNMLKQQ